MAVLRFSPRSIHAASRKRGGGPGARRPAGQAIPGQLSGALLRAAHHPLPFYRDTHLCLPEEPSTDRELPGDRPGDDPGQAPGAPGARISLRRRRAVSFDPLRWTFVPDPPGAADLRLLPLWDPQGGAVPRPADHAVPGAGGGGAGPDRGPVCGAGRHRGPVPEGHGPAARLWSEPGGKPGRGGRLHSAVLPERTAGLLAAGRPVAGGPILLGTETGAALVCRDPRGHRSARPGYLVVALLPHRPDEIRRARPRSAASQLPAHREP